MARSRPGCPRLHEHRLAARVVPVRADVPADRIPGHGGDRLGHLRRGRAVLGAGLRAGKPAGRDRQYVRARLRAGPAVGVHRGGPAVNGQLGTARRRDRRCHVQPVPRAEPGRGDLRRGVQRGDPAPARPRRRQRSEVGCRTRSTRSAQPWPSPGDCQAPSSATSGRRSRPERTMSISGWPGSRW